MRFYNLIGNTNAGRNYLSVTHMKVQIKKSNAVQKYLPPILLRRQGKIVEESAAEYFAAWKIMRSKNFVAMFCWLCEKFAAPQQSWT